MGNAPNPGERLALTLRKPVNLSGEFYTELVLREPTGGEWIEFDKFVGVEKDVKAIALVSGVPEPAVNLIGSRDIVLAAKFIGQFVAVPDQIDSEEELEELTVTLRKPVTLGETTWSELKLHEPSAATWIEFDKLGGVAGDIRAIALVSGVPEAAVRMIGARDIIRAASFIAGFLSVALPIGANG